MKKIAYLHTAMKSLRKMQPKRAEAIRAKIEAFANGQAVDLKKLTNRPGFRIRVGQDRAIVNLDGEEITVLDVGPRGGIYEE